MTRSGSPHETVLVHDYLLVMRGAERTFAAMAACWPEAPILTLLHDPVGVGDRLSGRAVAASYLQRLGVGQDGFRRLLPLFPAAAARLPVQQYDLVISSSSAFAHGVRPREGAVHVCYCHSPFRYVWHERGRALEETPRLLRPLTEPVLDHIRGWDLRASRRVTRYVANSQITRQRIERFWGRESSVVHPPVEVDRFTPGTAEDFFLVVTELVPHKQVSLALEGARRAEVPMKVVGTGPDAGRLQATYGGVAEFLGRISDRDLARLYPRARALVVPNIEEFGIAAVEAQAAGRPVVAADGGGARETVVDGATGVLFPAGDVDALAEALRQTDFDRFSPVTVRRHAAQFSTDAFQRNFIAEVERAVADRQ